MRSARRLYRLHVILATLGGLTLAASGWIALRSVDGSAPSAQELIAACRDVLGGLSLGSSLVLVLGALTTMAAVRAARATLRQLLMTRRFLTRARPVDDVSLAGVCVRLIADQRAHAFCAGLLRPRVYLSTGARRALKPAELRAVLAHEEHHARRRDPLRLLLARVASEALFFLPVLRRAEERYAELAEIAADEAAVRSSGGPGPLAAAMLRFDEHAVPGTVGIAPERVEHLLGARPRWQLPPSLLAAGALSLVAVLALAYATAVATPSPGAISISTLWMQLCGLALLTIPAFAVAWLLRSARRALRR